MTNKEYEKLRNLLIPLAVRKTNEVAGITPSIKGDLAKKKWGDSWNRIFFKEMNELAKAEGLVK